MSRGSHELEIISVEVDGIQGEIILNTVPAIPDAFSVMGDFSTCQDGFYAVPIRIEYNDLKTGAVYYFTSQYDVIGGCLS